MFSKRRNEYLAGGFFLALVAAVVVNIVTSPINEESFGVGALKILADIDGDRNLFLVGTAADIISNFFGIGIAATLFVVFRRHDSTLAALGSVGFLVGSVMFMASDLLLLSLESLSEQFFAASGSQADAVLASAGAISPLLDASIPMGATAVGLGTLGYGLLIAVTGAIPRWIGGLGILAGIVLPFGWLLYIDGELILIAFIGLLISLLFALTAGLWLIARGTTEASAQ